MVLAPEHKLVEQVTTPDQRRAAIDAVENFTLTTDTIDQVLGLPDETWLRISNEVIAVVDLAMRSEIRDVNLNEVRARLPALVAIDFNETRLVESGVELFLAVFERALENYVMNRALGAASGCAIARRPWRQRSTACRATAANFCCA